MTFLWKSLSELILFVDSDKTLKTGIVMYNHESAAILTCVLNVVANGSKSHPFVLSVSEYFFRDTFVALSGCYLIYSVGAANSPL